MLTLEKKKRERKERRVQAFYILLLVLLLPISMIVFTSGAGVPISVRVKILYNVLCTCSQGITHLIGVFREVAHVEASRPSPKLPLAPKQVAKESVYFSVTLKDVNGSSRANSSPTTSLAKQVTKVVLIAHYYGEAVAGQRVKVLLKISKTNKYRFVASPKLAVESEQLLVASLKQTVTNKEQFAMRKNQVVARTNKVVARNNEVVARSNEVVVRDNEVIAGE